jgi:hypothetical protein
MMRIPTVGDMIRLGAETSPDFDQIKERRTDRARTI